MATRIWKDVLYRGTLRVPTGNAKKPFRSVTFTDSDLANVVTIGREKVADGWQIPACWEHQNVGPVQLSEAEKDAEQTKSTFGRATDFRVGKGCVEALVEVDDDADLKALKSVRFVSPEVQWDWVDSTGKLWPGLTISHVAATARPVQHKQQAFQLSHTATGRRLRLSLESIHMADEKETPEEGSGGGEAKFKAAIEMLGEHGIVLPDDVTAENAWDYLCVALTALKGSKGDDVEPDMDEDDLDDTADVAPTTQTPPVSLSLQKQQAQAESLARKGLLERTERLMKSGRITPLMAGKLKSEALRVKLSFNGEGDLSDSKLVNQIEAYEALPKNASWSKKGGKAQLSHTTAVEPPDFTSDGPADTPEARKKRLADFEATTQR